MPSLTARHTITSLAVALATALALTACGSGAADASPSSAPVAGELSQQTAERDGVEIVVSGRLGAADATMEIELTRHDGELTNDLMTSTATVGGVPLGAPVWDGDPATGHHRAGRLSFPGLAGRAGPVVLTLSGWPETIVLRWGEQGAVQRSGG